MCTVSFSPRPDGYVLGMNRDEKLTRVAGLSPARRQVEGRTILSPSEPGGGTWIGVNDAGTCFALINWYSVGARVDVNPASRGMVVNGTITTDSPEQTAGRFAALPLACLNPFRLIGIFPRSREVVEWRWNLQRLEPCVHPWAANTWISSGLDEPGAQETRGKVFRESLLAPDAGSLEWVRRLHRSHAPARGAYSTCMHRDDASTVSYTEIALSSPRAVMRHSSGSPCCATLSSEHWIKL